MASQGAVRKTERFRELDESGLNEFSQDDYCELLKVYLDVMPLTLASLNQAFAEGEARVAEALLHKLKSNTAYICTSDLSASCGNLEKRLRLEPLPSLRDEGQEIIDRCRMLLDEIQQFLEG